MELGLSDQLRRKEDGASMLGAYQLASRRLDDGASVGLTTSAIGRYVRYARD